MAEERIYTIPLRKEWRKVPIYKRSGKAITAIKQFLKKHLKKEVRIGAYLNEFVWERGNRHPPGKVKIRIDEGKDSLTAELINAPKVIEKEEKKKEKKTEVKEEKTKEQELDKKAIEKVPIDRLKEKEEKKEVKIVDKKKKSAKEEKIIPTEKSGQLRKD